MNAISDALVYAVTCINVRDSEDEDDDVGDLESIAAILRSAATEEEKDVLAAAAQRAMDEEQSGGAREVFLEGFSTWMEDMFGGGWIGNQRAG
jgi:hypothetical protein